ncbi:MAG: hypothetical protein OEY85_07060, partial [Rhodospirillales bacterium]|nr:hypothetical protein [Rhodospirillales bacterium]
MAAALTILLVFAVWHLSQGPVSLAFLTPYVEDILATSHKSFRLKLDDTILTWGGWNRAFDIRVINARAMTPDGVVMAQIPEMSMSLSTNAMVRGLLAPETIELFRPSLYLIRRQDGTFALGFEQKEGPSTELVARIFSELVSSPDPDNAMSYLSRVNIIKAGLTIEDQQFNSSWHSSSADIKLVRNKRGIKGEASLDLFVDGKQTQFTILGDYHAKDKRLDFGVAFNDLRPSIFSRVTPEFSPLEMLNLSLKGTVTVSMIIDGTLEMVGFDISGGQGRISFPNPVAQNFEVKDAQLSGRYEGSSDTLEIVNLSLNLGENGSLLLPAPIDHRFPVKSIKTSASYSPRRKRLEIKSFEAGLPGPKASLRAIAEGIGGDVSINVGVDL